MKTLLKNLLRPLYRKVQAHLPHKITRVNFTPTAPHPELPDIFIFAVIDWSFRIQRPQHFAKALAQKGHRVFYISNNFINSPTPCFDAINLDPNLPLYHVHLGLMGSPSIYSHELKESEFKQLKSSLNLLLNWTQSTTTLSLIDHAFWTDLALAMLNNQIIYDCMDDHAGFENTANIVLEKEKILFQQSNLVLASSQKLYDHAKLLNPNTVLIRNATDYDFFKNKPEKIYTDKKNRKILGYYGAIAEWFDINLIEKLAQKFPDVLILLLGNDTVGAGQKLKKYKNIIFTGEVEYKKLPYYLYSFDVCLIPFHIIPLTEATNPVKVYEYLSAGKPVMSVDLPELRELADLNLVSIGKNTEDFCEKAKLLLNTSDILPLQKTRQDYAKHQTWTDRIDAFEQAVNKPNPLVSIIVLTYNNLDLTKACLESLEKHTDYNNYEIIIVDNLSTDGTQDYLKTHYSHHKIILNSENKGFSAGNNIGLKAATGEYLVILNNDTEVTPGWLTTLVNHLKRNPDIGLIGPVTNNIGNEAKIITHYKNNTQMLEETHKITLQHMGELTPIKTLAFFCVMIPRKILDQIGLLDEQFGLGFFEDDDYCRRIEQAGYKLCCAKDVFVHHHLSASFNKISNKKRQGLFKLNKKLYEQKWGEWEKHHIPIENKIASKLARTPFLSITPKFIKNLFVSLIALIFICAIGIFGQHIKALWNYTVDDSFISLRYAYHLSHYGKILWNLDQYPTEGYTSFLHVILLSLGFFTYGSALLWSKLMGILALLGVGLIIFRAIALNAKNVFFVTTLAILYAFLLTDIVTAIHTMAGLETGLYFLLLFSSSLLFLSINNPVLLPKLFSWRVFLFALSALLTGLTRPEANLYEFIFIIATVIQLKKLRLGYFLKNITFVYFIPGALYFTWRWMYYGMFLPLPFYIKFNHAALFPGLPDVKLFLNYYWPLLLTMVIFWLGGFKRHKAVVIAYLCVFIAGLLFSLHADPIMNYAFRFSWPLITFVLSSAWVIADKPEKNQVFYAALIIIAMGIFMYKNHNTAHNLEIQSLKYSVGLEKAHITLGKSLSAVSSQQPLVTCDAGAIPFYSHWPVIDSCALNDKILATTPLSDTEKADYIFSQKPRIIILISQSAKILKQPLLTFQQPLYDQAVHKNMRVIKTYEFMPNYYLWVIAYPQDKAIISALKHGEPS